MSSRASWFSRYLLPGFAFKAIVIGGGYATGRELTEFFLNSGPRGGLMGMLLATLLWSIVCTVTFLFARATHSRDYRAFFANLLGPLWPIFEIAYVLIVVLVLSVFGAAAGEIGQTLLGWPKLAGTLVLIVAIALVVSAGNASVERMFKYITIFLYAVYAIFVVLGLATFGDSTLAAFAKEVPGDGWVLGGIAYAGYNVIGAVAILPVLRHQTSRRDALIAGLLAGPLAMLPALLFFICMVAYYPEILDRALPSDFLLEKLNLPIFRVIFQTMIFTALLESGAGFVHAINERIDRYYRARATRAFPKLGRLAASALVLLISVFVADRFGLVALIARGYRGLTYVVLAVFVIPLLTYGVWRLVISSESPGPRWRGSEPPSRRCS